MIPEVIWPEDISEVECVGFSEGILYNLMVAIDHKRVTHVSTDKNAWYASYTFDYLGFRYVLDCSGFTPYRLQKIARLGVDDDGETIVEEKYPITGTAQPLPQPDYLTEWGSF